jgi:hypothetical protein
VQDFELGFVDAGGLEQRTPLAAVRFEECRPVRSFPSFKGQRNFPWLWWSATMGHHGGCPAYNHGHQRSYHGADCQRLHPIHAGHSCR